MDDVDLLIEAVRSLHPGLEQACMNGNCYKFHEVLARVYPGAVPYMNEERDHVVTRIGNVLYDVRGRVGTVAGKVGERYHRMSDVEVKVAKKWKRNARS